MALKCQSLERSGIKNKTFGWILMSGHCLILLGIFLASKTIKFALFTKKNAFIKSPMKLLRMMQQCPRK